MRKFTELAPWELKEGKRETCLCKSCENFGMQETALDKVMAVLQDAMLDGAADLAKVPEDERDPVLSIQQYQDLYQLNQFKRRIEKVESLLCTGAFKDGKMGCIDPGGCGHDVPCDDCGFKSV